MGQFFFGGREMITSLTDDQLRLLLELCRSAGPLQLGLAEKLMNEKISPLEIDELCELISNEFMMNGIEESFEPNEYGRELENLLDSVNTGRLH
jgi:hypothetical protein